MRCAPCSGKGRRHFRRTGKFVIEARDSHSALDNGDFARFIDRLPDLIEASAATQRLDNPQWEQTGATGWVSGDRVAKLAVTGRPDGPIDLAASGSKEPAWRSQAYLERLTAPVLQAFKTRDYAKLRHCEAGREIMARAGNPMAETPILDAYGLSTRLLPKIAWMQEEVAKQAKRGEWLIGLLLGLIALVCARLWIDLPLTKLLPNWGVNRFGLASFVALILPYVLMFPLMSFASRRRQRRIVILGLRPWEVALPRLWPGFVGWILAGYVIGTLCAAYLPWPFAQATCLMRSNGPSLTTGECFDLLFRAPWRWLGLAPQTF